MSPYSRHSTKRLRNNERGRSSSSDVILLSDDEIRKERNRKASANYRKRKNDLIETLYEETKMLKQKLNEMSGEYENARNGVEIILEQLNHFPASYETNNIIQQLNGLFKIPKPIEHQINKEQMSSKTAVYIKRLKNKFYDPSQQQSFFVRNSPNQRHYKRKTSMEYSKNNGMSNATISNDTVKEPIYQKETRIRPTTLFIIEDEELQPSQVKNFTTPYYVSNHDIADVCNGTINEPIHQKPTRVRPTTLSIITEQESSQLINVANHNIVEVFDSPGILFVSAFLKNYHL